MKMPKKSTRRIIRKRIAQRKSKDAAKQKNNSIRGQLMNVAAQNIANGIRPFGYASQQYGNINNERRIEQLRNDSNLKSSELQNTNAIIENMQKEIKDYQNELKNAKKEKKRAKAELEKTRHEKDMMDDELQEAERIERDNDRLSEQKRIREKRLAEISNENHIIELKQKNLNLREAIHKQDLELIEKQKYIESNTIYNENNNLQNELDATIAKHAYYDGIMESDVFKNPNKERIEKMKQLAIEKEKLRQTEELYNLAMENKRQEEILRSQPSKEEYAAIANEFASERNEIKQRSMELEKQKSDLQDEADIVNYQHEQYMNARKNEIDEQHKLDMLRKENIYLKNQLNKDGSNKLYAAQIKNTAKIRAKGLRKAIIVNMKQDLLKQKFENDTLEKISDLMNEEPTEEEKQLAKNIGENTARKEVLKEQQRLKNESHASSLKLVTEKANSDFRDSPEYQKYLKDNNDIKTETQINLNKADILKMTTEYAKQMDQSRITYEVTQKLVDANEPAYMQLNYHLQESTKLYQNMTEDLSASNIIKNALRAKIGSFPDRWDSFIELDKNERIPELLDNPHTGIEILKDIYYRFENYLGKTPPNSPPALKYQPKTEDNDVEDDQDFFD